MLANVQNMKTFFSEKHKMLSKFISIFYNVISTKNLNFGMFHFFGEMNYINFLNNYLQYTFLLIPILHTYPDQDEVVFKIFCSLCETNLEIILANFEEDIIPNIVHYFGLKFQQLCESSQNDK